VRYARTAWDVRVHTAWFMPYAPIDGQPGAKGGAHSRLASSAAGQRAVAMGALRCHCCCTGLRSPLMRTSRVYTAVWLPPSHCRRVISLCRWLTRRRQTGRADTACYRVVVTPNRHLCSLCCRRARTSATTIQAAYFPRLPYRRATCTSRISSYNAYLLRTNIRCLPHCCPAAVILSAWR